jgi:hypothetical protein
MTVDALSDLDLSYTHPSAAPGTPSSSPAQPSSSQAGRSLAASPASESAHEAAAVPRHEDAYLVLFPAAADTIAAAARSSHR